MSSDPTRANRRWWNRTSGAYQRAHDPQLAASPLAWGVWAIPEAELRVLGDVRGRDVLEFGCGAARWSIALVGKGARCVGLDVSEVQLAHARAFAREAGAALPLVQASGERAPFRDGSFDVVFCDHGATTWARPDRTVAEAGRLLRPGGRFVFNVTSPLHDLCWEGPDEPVEARLRRAYFTLDALEEGDCTSFQRPYGAWIRLFRRNGFVVEDLIELRPSADAHTTYSDFVPLDWARRWPAENIWVLSRS